MEKDYKKVGLNCEEVVTTKRYLEQCNKEQLNFWLVFITCLINDRSQNGNKKV